MIHFKLEPGLFNRFRLTLYKDHKRLTPFSPELPLDLRSLAHKSISYSSFEKELSSVLDANPSYLIELRLHKESFRLVWDSALKGIAKTHFHILSSHISVSKTVSFGATFKTDIYMLTPSLFVDLDQKKLIFLKEDGGWAHWNAFHRGVKEKKKDTRHSKDPTWKRVYEDTFDIPFSTFNTLQMEFEDPVSESARDLILTTETGLKPRMTSVAQPSVFVFTEDYFDSVRIAVHYLVQGVSLPASYDAFFRKTVEFPQLKWRLAVIQDNWTWVPISPHSELKIYTMIFERFGTDIERDPQTRSIRVSKQNLLLNMDLFRQDLLAEGFSCVFNNKPIKTLSLTFDVETVKQEENFLVSPRVFSQGDSIPYEEWLGFLEGGGWVEKEDGVHILDSVSYETLKAILRLLPSRRKETSFSKKNVISFPKLRILEWLHLKRFGVRFQLPPEEKRILETLTGFHSLPTRPKPRLKQSLRPYQIEGYFWLAFLYENRFGACLADDMGLGKTIQALALIAGIKEGFVRSHVQTPCPHLVIVPPSLMFNWCQEIQKWYPDLKVSEYVGGKRVLDTSSDIILTTYESIRRDAEQLKDTPFHVILFDEAQLIKNIMSGRTSAVRKLNGVFKICLTGTPLENHLGEYYSIIDLSLPGLFGSYAQFKTLMNTEGIEPLIRRSLPFVLRRTKSSLLKELPPKMESIVYLTLTPIQKQLYNMIAREIRSLVVDAYKHHSETQAKMIALTAMLRLRQLCLSPQLLDASIQAESPKIQFLVTKLEELQTEGHSALIFTQFRSLLDIMEKELQNAGLPYLRMDGKTKMTHRKNLITTFQGSETPLFFLISLKTGGVGLNLTQASYVFFLDPWWNPSVEDQASDRAHRIGQTRQVFVVRLVMHHSIEEKMMALKEKKRMLFDTIMESGISRKDKRLLTRKDFEFLLEGVN